MHIEYWIFYNNCLFFIKCSILNYFKILLLLNFTAQFESIVLPTDRSLKDNIRSSYKMFTQSFSTINVKYARIGKAKFVIIIFRLLLHKLDAISRRGCDWYQKFTTKAFVTVTDKSWMWRERKWMKNRNSINQLQQIM